MVEGGTMIIDKFIQKRKRYEYGYLLTCRYLWNKLTVKTFDVLLYAIACAIF